MIVRLLQNRKPETMLYTRKSKNLAILRSICAYNHVSDEVAATYLGKNTSVLDEETGMRFRQLGGGPTLNLNNLEDLQPAYDKLIGNEFIGTGNHEQYFYKDYYAYQPTYADKIMLMAKILTENGYRYITAEEFK